MNAFDWESLRASVGGWWSVLDGWWEPNATLREVISRAWTWERMETAVELARPVGPISESSVLSPIVGAAGALAAVVLLGVAASSMLTMLAALLALAFVLNRLFGLSLEFAPFGGPRPATA